MPGPNQRMTWELRWHPFRGQWVLFTSHRDARPWIGEIMAPVEPPIPENNALAPLAEADRHDEPRLPGGVRLHERPASVLPRRTGAHRSGTMSTGPARPAARRRLSVITTTQPGRWPISPTRSARHRDDVARAVVGPPDPRTASPTCSFSRIVAHVVGTSNPHPHCQIYAGSLVYATMAREAEVASEHFQRTGRAVLKDVIDRELAGPRVISEA